MFDVAGKLEEANYVRRRCEKLNNKKDGEEEGEKYVKLGKD